MILQLFYIVFSKNAIPAEIRVLHFLLLKCFQVGSLPLRWSIKTVSCHSNRDTKPLWQIERRSERIPTLKDHFTQMNTKGARIISVKSLPSIERKPDSTLPRMTPRQRQAAVILIRNTCSNYYGGNCLLLDDGEECICVQSISYSVNCKFFRWALLEDKAGHTLKAEIFRGETTKHCTVCNKAFQSTSNNAKYCNDCKENVQRKQKAAHARKRRSRVEK